jgi:prolyl-tRNA synthetase
MNSHTIDYLSTALTKTLRSGAGEVESVNGLLLSRAGFISQMAAGIFTMLPLGRRVLSRIETILREEMHRVDSHEFSAPMLHTRQIMDTTGRWESIDVLYRLRSRQGADLCLQATAEEAVCAALQGKIASHRDLPISLYQISDKLRDEQRPRAGLIRGRSFRMKDLYSFHLNERDLDQYYERVVAAYLRVFERCGIGANVVRTFASGGAFSRFSDEFQLLCDSGEDTIFITEDRSRAINREVAEDAEALRAIFGETRPKLLEHRAIEVGNTFKLGTRYTDAFGIEYQDETGALQKVWMASYGIGTTRLVGSVAEVLSDERGLVWPKEIAPYDAHIVVLGDRSKNAELLERVTRWAAEERITALIDAREEVRAGEKFADADLIGIPIRIVVSERCGEDSLVEVKRRTETQAERVMIEELGRFV